MCGAPASDFRVKGVRLDRHQGLRPRGQAGACTTVVRCKGCGLIMCQPLPLPLDIAQHYEMEPEDYWSREDVEQAASRFRHEAARARELLDNRSDLRALDVGAGLGGGMLALQREGFDVFGLEPSASFRQFAVESMGVDEGRLALTSLEEADYPAASFDFVAFPAVLEHLPDPGAALERAARWLRPGGLMQAEVPSSDWLMGRLLNLYYRAIGTSFVTNTSPMHPPFHLFEFTERAFRMHGQRVGYQVEELTRIPGSTFLPRAADTVLRPLMRMTRGELQLSVWLRTHS